MKISIFVHCYPPAKGGLEHLTAEIANYWGKEHEVHVFTGKGRTLDSYKTFSYWVEHKTTNTKVIVHRLNIKFFWQKMANKFLYGWVIKLGVFSPWYFGPLLQFQQEHERIIADSHVLLAVGMPTSSLFYGDHYARKFKKKLLILPAYHEVPYYNNVPVFQRALKHASRIIFLSFYEKRRLASAYDFSDEKAMFLSYSPFSEKDFPRFSKMLTQRLEKLKKTPLVIGFVGQVAARKKLEIIADISEEMRDIPHKVLIAGLRTNSSHLVERQFAQRTNVEFRYDFFEEEKADILSCIDIFISPSEEESYGIATLEAMAAGCLVFSRFSFSDSQEVPFIFNSSHEAAKAITNLSPDDWQSQLERQAELLKKYTQEQFQKQLQKILDV